jgi:hypothetical protein
MMLDRNLVAVSWRLVLSAHYNAAPSDQLTNLARELSLIRAGIDRGLGILLEDSGLQTALCASRGLRGESKQNHEFSQANQETPESYSALQ